MSPKIGMGRNIRPSNFALPASEAEVRAAALRIVRKISGFNKASHANEEAFARAVDEVVAAAARKARKRGRVRFAAPG